MTEGERSPRERQKNGEHDTLRFLIPSILLTLSHFFKKSSREEVF